MTAMTIQDLSPREFTALLDETERPMGETQRRQQHLRQRYLLLREDYDTISNQWIVRHYNNPDHALEICKHALPLYNALKRGVDRIAVAYQRKPRRELKKASKGANRTWLEILKKIRFDAFMRQANRFSVGMNTAIILPKASMDGHGDPFVDFELVTGAVGMVALREGASVLSAPGILAYRVVRKDLTYETASPDDPFIVIVDSNWYTVLNRQRKVLSTHEHGLGVFPGVVVRNTIPEPDDWWDPWPNKGVVRTVEIVHRIIAEMNMTRRSHRTKQVVATIDEESEGEGELEGQTMADPDAIWRFRGMGSRLEMLDLVSQIKEFVDHKTELQDEALEQMTGAVARVADPDPSNPLVGEAAVIQHNAIELHRQAQAEQLEPADLELQWKTALVLQKIGYPGAPSPDVIREKATIQYAEIPLIQDPKARLDYHVLATKFGVSDQVEFRREQTGQTREEALEDLLKMAEDRAKLHELQAERNLPSDPTAPQREEDPSLPGERPEAATGRRGGRARPSEAEANA